MVDSSGVLEQPFVGLHSSSIAGSSSFPSQSDGILKKKGKKTVGGFDFTSELQSIAKSILALEVCPPPLIQAAAKDDDNRTKFFDDEDDGSPEDWVPTTTTKNSVNCHTSTVRRALAPMPQEEALEAIRVALLERTDNKTTSLVPLSTIKAMSNVIHAYAIKYPAQSQKADDIRNQLEKALLSSTLNFDVKVQEMTREQMEEAAKFEKRMQLLRMKAEEKKYQRLTENLEKPLDEEMNVKSMTYAASIGLNMIVAPVSFGILAYFVSGMYFFSDSVTTTNLTQPRDANINRTYKVICAVIAGVSMMFIEMILFVIRSNEMEYYTSKKKKKNLKMYGPFGNKEAAQVAKTRNTATIAPLTIKE